MPYSSPQAPSTPSTPLIPATPTNGAQTSVNSISNSAPSNAFIGCLLIAVALSLTLFSLGYRRYRTRQRSRLLKRQIAMLEAMWRISSTK